MKISKWLGSALVSFAALVGCGDDESGDEPENSGPSCDGTPYDEQCGCTGYEIYVSCSCSCGSTVEVSQELLDCESVAVGDCSVSETTCQAGGTSKVCGP